MNGCALNAVASLFSSSVELIRQMRDERTEELMRRHQTTAPKHNP